MIALRFVMQFAIVAHVPDTASVCAPFELTVAARVAGMVAPQIDLPASSAFQLLRRTMTSRTERDGGGRPSTISEGTFIVAVHAAGHVTLPGFVATAGALRAASLPRALDVRPRSEPPPTVLVRARLARDSGAESRQALYVGEEIEYVVDVQLDEAARGRLRRNPTFFPPEMPAVLAYDLPAPSTVERGGRRCFETLSYRRALFPIFAGQVAIAPATLTYSLPVSTSFFSREENVELHTESTHFLVREPPGAGRPAGFDGAVGEELRVTSRLSASASRMGDPVVVTLRVQGAGNVKLWPRPPLLLSWAAVALGEERIEVDTIHARVHGAKEFDWLLTPRVAGARSLPAIEYQYFDPRLERYQRASTAPIGLNVALAALASTDTTAIAHFPIRRVLRDARTPFLPSRSGYWLLLALAPLPVVVRSARTSERRRRRALSPSAALHRAALDNRPLSSRELRRMFYDALADRVGQPRDASPHDSLARTLRRAGVGRATVQHAERIAHELDAAAYSPRGTIDSATAAEAHAVMAAIDTEALCKTDIDARARQAVRFTRPTVLVVAITLSLATATVLSATSDSARHAFADGVHRYERADYAGAQRSFARVAEQLPRAIDAWANAGTAAWARGDTAAAARAWQRTLRLDPMDAEVSARLATMQRVSLSSRASVAPISPDILAAAALALWMASWLMLAIPVARRPAFGRASARAGLAISVILLLASLEVVDRLDPRAVAVLRSSRSLLDAPTPDGQAVGGASAGEGGTLGARDGEWVRLTLDATRTGWVRVRDILPLDAPATAN